MLTFAVNGTILSIFIHFGKIVVMVVIVRLRMTSTLHRSICRVAVDIRYIMSPYIAWKQSQHIVVESCGCFLVAVL